MTREEDMAATRCLRERLAALCLSAVLGGSWAVISRVISRVTILITHIRGLITPLMTTHEPPSRVLRP